MQMKVTEIFRLFRKEFASVCGSVKTMDDFIKGERLETIEDFLRHEGEEVIIFLNEHNPEPQEAMVYIQREFPNGDVKDETYPFSISILTNERQLSGYEPDEMCGFLYGWSIKPVDSKSIIKTYLGCITGGIYVDLRMLGGL